MSMSRFVRVNETQLFSSNWFNHQPTDYSDRHIITTCRIEARTVVEVETYSEIDNVATAYWQARNAKERAELLARYKELVKDDPRYNRTIVK